MKFIFKNNFFTPSKAYFKNILKIKNKKNFQKPIDK